MPSIGEFDGYIFDYGGVLVFQQTPEDLARMSSICGLPVQRFEKLYWERRLEYDEDQLSADQYWATVAGGAAGRTLTDEQIRGLIDADNESWMHYDEAMWDWIAELHAAGKKIALLSNMPRQLGVALRHKTERLNAFDHVTLSYELGCAKPSRQIYEHSLAGIGTAPARTLFLDDRIANVQGAEAAGIRALQFTSREEILSALSAV